MALTIGLVLSGCDNATNSTDGGTKTTTYTVTFDGGDGTGTPPASQTVAENTSISLPGKGDLTAPAEKEFNGWKTGGVSYAAGDSYTVKGNVTFIAQWKAAAQTSTGYTITFDADGGTPATSTETVATSGGNVNALPANPIKTGYTFDGWYTEKNGGGTAFTAATPVAANITVYAKWKAANPFIGGIWLDWAGNVNYKFTETGGAKVYSTANTTTFNVAGTYDFDTTRKELTLRPEGGSPIVKSYEIDKSLLIFEKGKAGATWYTKNPETGGGFNGDPASAPLGGMWQNINDADDTLGFNKDGEYFITDVQQNRDGKHWWSVIGTYEYKTVGDKKELTLRHNGIDGQLNAVIYTVEFATADQVLKLTETDGAITTFNKRDNL
jgi:uncharacterized repeat protein (TIGR02543 family)